MWFYPLIVQFNQQSVIEGGFVWLPDPSETFKTGLTKKEENMLKKIYNPCSGKAECIQIWWGILDYRHLPLCTVAPRGSSYSSPPPGLLEPRAGILLLQQHAQQLPHLWESQDFAQKWMWRIQISFCDNGVTSSRVTVTFIHAMFIFFSSYI